MANQPPRGFGLPRKNGASGGGPGGPPPPPGGNGGGGFGDSGEAHEDFTLSIRGVSTATGEQPDEIRVTLDTTRGAVTLHLLPCEGHTGVVIFLGGAGGGVKGPADDVYIRLGPDLVRSGVTVARVEYRQPGEFEECVMDALAACSFLRGIGAEQAVLVGHSFGGAVAVKAALLTDLSAAVAGLSSQRYGAYDVDTLGKPLLLIHGSADRVLDQQASRDIYDRAQEPKRLVILEGSGHGLREHRDQVFDLLLAFIVEHASDAESTQNGAGSH